jgi:hypothetical protein
LFSLPEYVGIGPGDHPIGGLLVGGVRPVSPSQMPLTINSGMVSITRAMQRPDSGLEVRDRMWLKIKISNAFIGSDVVDWLYGNVEGFEVNILLFLQMDCWIGFFFNLLLTIIQYLTFYKMLKM